ncbi:MAG: DUF3597 family protein [Rubrivivax sp.]
MCSSLGRSAACPAWRFHSFREVSRSLFSNILRKLGFGAGTDQAAADPAAAPAPANPQKLNWKLWIVDLTKLLELDSSLTFPKTLVTELGCPVDKMGDSVQMNMGRHKAVLRKLAENGGSLLAELL